MSCLVPKGTKVNDLAQCIDTDVHLAQSFVSVAQKLCSSGWQLWVASQLRQMDSQGICGHCGGVGGHLTSCPTQPRKKPTQSTLSPAVVASVPAEETRISDALQCVFSAGRLHMAQALALRSCSKQLKRAVDASRWFWGPLITQRWGNFEGLATNFVPPPSDESLSHFERYLHCVKQMQVIRQQLQAQRSAYSASSCSRFLQAEVRGEPNEQRDSVKGVVCLHCSRSSLDHVFSDSMRTGFCSMATYACISIWRCRHCRWYTHNWSSNARPPRVEKQEMETFDAAIESLSPLQLRSLLKNVLARLSSASTGVDARSVLMDFRASLEKQRSSATGTDERLIVFCDACYGVDSHLNDCRLLTKVERRPPLLWLTASAASSSAVEGVDQVPHLVCKYLGDVEYSQLSLVCRAWRASVACSHENWQRRLDRRFSFHDDAAAEHSKTPYERYVLLSLEKRAELRRSRTSTLQMKNSTSCVYQQHWFECSRKLDDLVLDSKVFVLESDRPLVCGWCLAREPEFVGQTQVSIVNNKLAPPLSSSAGVVEAKGTETTRVSVYHCNVCKYWTKNLNYEARAEEDGMK